jgi:hypothetical protein
MALALAGRAAARGDGEIAAAYRDAVPTHIALARHAPDLATVAQASVRCCSTR